jgi:ABC-2 type transport system permease protein
MVITCIVAPLALSAILGFAFGGKAELGTTTLGVSGASASLLRAAETAVELPANVTVRIVTNPHTLKREVTDGKLDAGVILSASATHLSSLLIPIAAPGASHSPGYDVVERPDSLNGQEWAEALAAGLASRIYAGRVNPGSADELTALAVRSQSLGNSAHAVLNYFAPSIAIIFLFIGSGLGLRSLMLERSAGTLVRLAAAPIAPVRVVLGKLLAIFITGLVSIFVVWGVTTVAFGAQWGSPGGVLLMSFGATAAMCGFGVFLTSLARNEKEAFGVALIVGLFLALLGGNLIPPGSLPAFLQTLSLATPNGWAVVGFGRLTLLHDPARDVLGPFLVLCLITAILSAIAYPRVRRMVQP